MDDAMADQLDLEMPAPAVPVVPAVAAAAAGADVMVAGPGVFGGGGNVGALGGDEKKVVLPAREWDVRTQGVAPPLRRETKAWREAAKNNAKHLQPYASPTTVVCAISKTARASHVWVLKGWSMMVQCMQPGESLCPGTFRCGEHLCYLQIYPRGKHPAPVLDENAPVAVYVGIHDIKSGDRVLLKSRVQFLPPYADGGGTGDSKANTPKRPIAMEDQKVWAYTAGRSCLGWNDFASHTELRNSGLIADDQLLVRADIEIPSMTIERDPTSSYSGTTAAVFYSDPDMAPSLVVGSSWAVPRALDSALLLQTRMREMLTRGQHPDVRMLTADGVYIPAHKAMLAAHSPVFEAALHTGMIECRENIIVTPNFATPIVLALLAFIYTGTILFPLTIPGQDGKDGNTIVSELQWSEVALLFEAGCMYDVKGLDEWCVSRMTRELTPQNVLAMMKSVAAHTITTESASRFLLVAKDFLTAHIADVLIPSDLQPNAMGTSKSVAPVRFKRQRGLWVVEKGEASDQTKSKKRKRSK